MDRRTTLKWVLAATAAASAPTWGGARSIAPADAQGYGTDPDLTRNYLPGELWPLTLSAAERRTATVLCDLIIPADDSSPSASSVGVVDFIDEWLSAPYAQQRQDRSMILGGLQWIEDQARARFGRDFSALSAAEHGSICDAICYTRVAAPTDSAAATFFARFRDLAAGGYYTTPQGTKDLGYVGNVPLDRYDGPPPELLKKFGFL
jgi:Gluconate 2-dehydrogenase subunit 3